MRMVGSYLKMPKFKKDGKVISGSFLMEKILTSPSILSFWPERNNKTTDRVSLSPERRLRRQLRKMKSGTAIGPDSIPVEV